MCEDASSESPSFDVRCWKLDVLSFLPAFFIWMRLTPCCHVNVDGRSGRLWPNCTKIQTRPQGGNGLWDIGADEYVSSRGTIFAFQ